MAVVDAVQCGQRRRQTGQVGKAGLRGSGVQRGDLICQGGGLRGQGVTGRVIGTVGGVQRGKLVVGGCGLHGKGLRVGQGLTAGLRGGGAVGQIAGDAGPIEGQGGKAGKAGQVGLGRGQGGCGGVGLLLHLRKQGFGGLGSFPGGKRLGLGPGRLIRGVFQAAVKLGGGGPQRAKGLEGGLGHLMGGGGGLGGGVAGGGSGLGRGQGGGGQGQIAGRAGFSGLGLTQTLIRQAQGFGAVQRGKVVAVGCCGIGLLLGVGKGLGGVVQAGLRLGPALMAGEVGPDLQALGAGRVDGGGQSVTLPLQRCAVSVGHEVVGVALLGQQGQRGLRQCGTVKDGG